MGSATQSIGSLCERRAESFLRKHGLKTLVRNFQCRSGEIDLVMLDGTTLVFVEVRFRKPNRFTSAVASVDSRKQIKLTRAARQFLGQHTAYADHPARFDVVGLDGPNSDEFTIQWLQDAFRPGSENAYGR